MTISKTVITDGEIIYEDAFQIAVKNQPEDAAIITKELQYQIERHG